MGSSEYTDFVTGLPIIEDSSLTYVLIISEKVTRSAPAHTRYSISDEFRPISFPLFGNYNSYGGFTLDDNYKKYNEIALKLLEADIEIEEPIKNQSINNIDFIVSATLLEYYNSVVFKENMAYQNRWQGEFEWGGTHKESFDKRIEEFMEWKEDKDSSEKYTSSGEAIIQPDVENIHLKGRLDFFINTHKELKQEFIIESFNQDEDYYTYLLGWYCFYHYLQYIRVPFTPTLGGVEHHEMKYMQKHLELTNQALNSITKERNERYDE